MSRIEISLVREPGGESVSYWIEHPGFPRGGYELCFVVFTDDTNPPRVSMYGGYSLPPR